MMICKGQDWLIGSQILRNQEECGINNIFLDFQNTCYQYAPSSWLQFLHRGSLTLIFPCLGNLGFSSCFCFSDTIFLGTAAPLHSSWSPCQLWQLSKLHSPCMERSSIALQIMHQPLDVWGACGPILLWGGQLFSEGSVNDSQVMVWWCSWLWDSLSWEVWLTLAYGGPNSQTELGTIHLFLQSCGFHVLVHPQTASHIHSHYSWKSITSFGTQLISAWVGGWNNVV